MTQEEKEQIEKGKLLVADLCARLPYKVKLQKVREPDTIYELYSIDLETLEIRFWKYKGKSLSIGDGDKLYSCGRQRYKPYLRSMSSMTEEEFEKLKTYSGLKYEQLDLTSYQNGTHKCLDFYLSEVPSYIVILVFDWLNEHHFDYRGLIERGLAIEAPKGMYT